MSRTIPQSTITAAIRPEIAEFVSFIPKLGHMPDEVFEQEARLHLLRLEELTVKTPDDRKKHMTDLFAEVAVELEQSPMFRHGRQKPFGYPGDHLMIDMIYSRQCHAEGRGKLWDEFYHRQSAPQAVRNRRTFFIETFAELCRATPAPAVLDIACGPCRDVVEGIIAAGENAAGSHFHCADMDANAISYAQNVLAECRDAKSCVSTPTFTWEIANAFRMRPDRKYDLAWSAGLFDYLDERTAALLLKKMWSWTSDGGELIVGNFHVFNPDRPWMEWCGDWRLIHRTEEDMLRLCDKAGIPANAARFHFEPLGVNMFLRVRKG